MAVSAELLGVPREIIPASVTALAGYIASVRSELRCTPAAAESMGYMLDPAGMGEEIAELWQDLRDAALAALPGWARDLYGYPDPPPVTPDAPDRDPPDARRVRRGIHGRAGGAGGAAAARPADAGGTRG